MKSIPYIKLDRLADVPTLMSSMWGQFRWKPGDYAATGDRLVYIGKDDTGALTEFELATMDDVGGGGGITHPQIMSRLSLRV